MKNEDTKVASGAGSKATTAPNSEARTYVGPQPAALVSNLPCGCKVFADQLTREQQDYLIATAPETAAWFES